jgi:heptosyltransferase-2
LKNRAVFFDRDGTLCAEADYLARWEDFRVFDEIGELGRLKELGFKIIGITNQSGIARGIVEESFVRGVSDFFVREHGFDAFYHCPHHPEEGCSCRKPSTGMIELAAREFDLDIKASYMIGDRELDVLTARRAGAVGILVRTGYEGESAEADFTAENLREAVDYIVGAEKEKRGR